MIIMERDATGLFYYGFLTGLLSKHIAVNKERHVYFKRFIQKTSTTMNDQMFRHTFYRTLTGQSINFA